MSTGGEYEYHIVGVRLRVTGSGNLDMSLNSYQNVLVKALVPLPMQAVTRIEPTRLSNFQAQRTKLVGEVDVIDEWFVINRIIIWGKPVAVEYPMVS
jgi:hypothetical protein